MLTIKNKGIASIGVLCIANLPVAGFSDIDQPIQGSAYEPERNPEKTNIVFIMADDLGWSCLGEYGSDLHETPNIDRLAKESMKFTDAYSAAAICSPTRASLMTGKYPARLNMTTWRENSGPPQANDRQKLLGPTTVKNLSLNEYTIAEAFKEAGYYTAHVGKWHLGDAIHYPEAHGFDINIGGTMWGMPYSYWYPFSGWRAIDGEFRYVPGLEDLSGDNKNLYLTDRLTDEALKIIEAKNDEPFFINLSYYTPHVPIEGKQEYTEHFSNLINPDMIHRNPGYAAMIKSLDENVGRILDKIEESGISGNTVVIFYSDNGGLATPRVNVKNNYPLRSGKGSLYEGGIRVPLIIKWPGHTKPGSISGYPVSTIDFYPTLLDIAGISGDEDHNALVDGMSLVSLLNNPAEIPEREIIFWHYPHYYQNITPPVSAMRKGQWKLIHYFEDDKIELFNLGDDPGEEHNLVQMHSEMAENMYNSLKTWRIRINARIPTFNPDYKPESW